MASARAKDRQSRLSQAMAEMTLDRNRWHVISNRGRWIVLRETAQRATGVFRNQRDAVEKALVLATPSGGEVIVHRQDATIQERLSPVSVPSPS